MLPIGRYAPAGIGLAWSNSCPVPFICTPWLSPALHSRFRVKTMPLCHPLVPVLSHWLSVGVVLLAGVLRTLPAEAGPLKAGVGKVDVSRADAGPCKPPLYVRTLAVSDGETTVVLASIDAVSIGQIGHIGNPCQVLVPDMTNLADRHRVDRR